MEKYSEVDRGVNEFLYKATDIKTNQKLIYTTSIDIEELRERIKPKLKKYNKNTSFCIPLNELGYPIRCNKGDFLDEYSGVVIEYKGGQYIGYLWFDTKNQKEFII